MSFSVLREQSQLEAEAPAYSTEGSSGGEAATAVHRGIARILLELNPVCKLLYGTEQTRVNPALQMEITHPKVIAMVSSGKSFFKDERVLQGANPEFRISDYEIPRKLTLGKVQKEEKEAEASLIQVKIKRRECRNADTHLKRRLFQHLEDSRRRVHHVKIGKSDPYRNRERSVSPSPEPSATKAIVGRDKAKFVTQSLGEALKTAPQQLSPTVHSPNQLSSPIRSRYGSMSLLSDEDGQLTRVESVVVPGDGDRSFAFPKGRSGKKDREGTVRMIEAVGNPEEQGFPQIARCDSIGPLETEGSFVGLRRRRSSFFATQPEGEMQLESTAAQPAPRLNVSQDTSSKSRLLGSVRRSKRSLAGSHRSASALDTSAHSVEQSHSQFEFGSVRRADEDALPPLPDGQRRSLRLEKFQGPSGALFLEYKNTRAATVLARNYRREDEAVRRRVKDESSRMMEHYRFIVEQGTSQAENVTKTAQRLERLSGERKSKYWKRFSAMDIRKPLPVRGTMAEILSAVSQATGTHFDNAMRMEEFSRECREFSKLEAYCTESYQHPLVFQMLNTAKGFLTPERAPRPEQFHNKIVNRLAAADLIFNDVVSTVIHLAKMCGVSRADAIDCVRQKAHHLIVNRIEEMNRTLTSASPAEPLGLSPSHRNAPAGLSLPAHRGAQHFAARP